MQVAKKKKKIVESIKFFLVKFCTNFRKIYFLKLVSFYILGLRKSLSLKQKKPTQGPLYVDIDTQDL